MGDEEFANRGNKLGSTRSTAIMSQHSVGFDVVLAVIALHSCPPALLLRSFGGSPAIQKIDTPSSEFIRVPRSSSNQSLRSLQEGDVVCVLTSDAPGETVMQLAAAKAMKVSRQR